MIKGLVSVIVPVYNVKSYLERCIDSILNQTYQNLEIIIVDDGSSDGSSEICDHFLEKDERIFILHKENGGVVSARQAGIERAKGEYSIAIDSDDWIEPMMINELYQLAVKHNADMVTSGYYRESNHTKGIFTDGLKEGVYSGDKKEILYCNMIFCGNLDKIGITGAIWSKLIKTSLMKEVHAKISCEICCAEDYAFVYGCCLYAQTIVVTHHIYYHYMMRTGSVVYSIIPYYFKDINVVYLFLKEEFQQNQYKEILLYQLDALMIKWVFFGLNYYMGLNTNLMIPYYDFDKSIIEKNAKVVLYGAGKVGQSFFQQICADKLYDIVGWVDEKFLYYQELGLDVTTVEDIRKFEFDYVLLAFKQKSLAESVKKFLIDEYNVKPNKIIWLKPIGIVEKYFLSGNE